MKKRNQKQIHEGLCGLIAFIDHKCRVGKFGSLEVWKFGRVKLFSGLAMQSSNTSTLRLFDSSTPQIHKKIDYFFEMDAGGVIEKIYEAAVAVFQNLGRGFTENIYQRAMFYELLDRGYEVEMESVVPISYNKVNVGFLRPDLIVRVRDSSTQSTQTSSELSDKRAVYVVELKAQLNLCERYVTQLLAYMKHQPGCAGGIVMNFSQRDPELRHGINISETLGENGLARLDINNSPCVVEAVVPIG